MAGTGMYLLLVTTVCVFGSVLADSEMARFYLYRLTYKTLTASHMKSFAPGEIDSGYRDVNLTLALSNIVDVDTTHRSLEATIVLKETFTDPRLRWDTNAHEGIDRINLPRTDVWIPDWQVFDALEKVQYFGEYSAGVTHDGTVDRFPLLKVKVRCGAKNANNHITCAFQIGSWAYTIDTVNPVFDEGKGIILDYFIDNPFWNVVKVSAEKVESQYYNNPETFASVKYTITLEEKNQCA